MIKDYQTLCRDSDAQITEWFKLIKDGKMSLTNLFYDLETLPYINRECDMTKEVIEVVFEELESLGYDIETIEKIYDEEREKMEIVAFTVDTYDELLEKRKR